MKAIRITGLVVVLCVAPRVCLSQSLETLELKKSEEAEESAWGFGFLGVFSTSTGLNVDRPEVSSLLWLAPQLKFQQIYRLQLNMGMLVYYLDRSTNPWDLTDWSLQLSDLSIFKEEYSEINLSGNLRYYIPLSNSSRNADSHGALRLLFKLSRSIWQFDLGLELMGTFRFAKYTTSDPARWQDPDKMNSNGLMTFGQRLTVSFYPLDILSVSLSFGMYQDQDYYPSEPYEGSGSSFIADEPRYNDAWEYSWEAGFDVTVNLWEMLYTSLGYSISMPILQGDSRGTHFDPFDAKYGSIYLDLMVIY